jgi:hypothetical protein
MGRPEFDRFGRPGVPSRVVGIYLELFDEVAELG